MDRIHALNLAMIRKAAELTQEELAERLGARQGDISRIENRSDSPLHPAQLLTAPAPTTPASSSPSTAKNSTSTSASLGRKKTDLTS